MTRPSVTLTAEDAVALFRKAAQLLLDAADTAQEDLEADTYWKSYQPATSWKDGFVNGFGGVSSDYVALLPPSSGQAIGQWLRTEGEIVQTRIDIGQPFWDVNATVAAAVVVAQGIVAAAEAQS